MARNRNKLFMASAVSPQSRQNQPTASAWLQQKWWEWECLVRSWIVTNFVANRQTQLLFWCRFRIKVTLQKPATLGQLQKKCVKRVSQGKSKFHPRQQWAVCPRPPSPNPTAKYLVFISSAARRTDPISPTSIWRMLMSAMGKEDSRLFRAMWALSMFLQAKHKCRLASSRRSRSHSAKPMPLQTRKNTQSRSAVGHQEWSRSCAIHIFHNQPRKLQFPRRQI